MPYDPAKLDRWPNVCVLQYRVGVNRSNGRPCVSLQDENKKSHTALTYLVTGKAAGLPVSDSWGGDSFEYSHLCERVWRFLLPKLKMWCYCVNPKHGEIVRKSINVKRNACADNCICDNEQPCLFLTEPELQAVWDLWQYMRKGNGYFASMPE